MQKTKIFLAAFLALSFVVYPDFSANSKSSWEVFLRQQLKNEKACEVKFLSRVREFKLAGRDAIEGRAHCIDNRDYDFSWNTDFRKFDLKRCQPAVC